MTFTLFFRPPLQSYIDEFESDISDNDLEDYENECDFEDDIQGVELDPKS